MKKWFQSLGDKIRGWMYGRYGSDELSTFLFVTALICMVLARLVPVLELVGWVLLIWSLLRICSRNIVKRQAERDVYLEYTGKVKNGINIRKDMWSERKTHRYYKCPNCKHYLRVPRGKGKIEISCPKCHNKMIRKT